MADSSVKGEMRISSGGIKERCSSVAVPCSLKRKRPPRIEIPNVLQEIETDKADLRDVASRDDSVCFNGDGVGVFSIKGKKKFMEDTYKIVSCLQGKSNKGFFGVYDGHGGKMAAEFVAENLCANILEMMDGNAGDVAKEEAVKAGYLKTDQEFLQMGLNSGACCVAALIEEQNMVISNLGDCRAVLCRGGVAEALTKDHRVEEENERKRIEDKGGYVDFRGGVLRVHGILSVSRSIGDAHLKDWVNAEPDTKIIHMTSDMQFLVLASDGLWDKVGNQEAVDTVIRFMGEKKSEPIRDIFKDNEDISCVNASPSSKLHRIALRKQQKGMTKSPKTEVTLKDADNDFDNESECPQSKSRRHLEEPFKDNDDLGRVNVSPSSKLRRISLVKQQKGVVKSPIYKKTDDNSENVSPPSKSRSLFEDFSSLNDEVGCVNTSPSSKLRRNSPMKSPSDNRKDAENDFNSENEGPPAKSQRISLVKRLLKRPDSPYKENCGHKKSPISTGLAGVCEELAKLAGSKGSKDDVTVMIIDLKHFRCNS